MVKLLPTFWACSLMVAAVLLLLRMRLRLRLFVRVWRYGASSSSSVCSVLDRGDTRASLPCRALDFGTSQRRARDDNDEQRQRRTTTS